MIKSIALWVVKAIVLLLLDIVTWVLSPIICLFVTHQEESEVTGFPSLFPGKPREFLVKQLRLFQSTDAPLDEYWYGDYPSPLKDKYSQAYYDNNWWLRYYCRIIWLVRNPAYGFGTKLGYNADGLRVIQSKDEEYKWRTGANCCSYWIFVNDYGQVGWQVRAQFYYYKSHCLEMYLGYKLSGDTIWGNKLVAMQFTPFRKYTA